MEISPERTKSIKTSLSHFMNRDEAERFIDLSYSTNLIKGGEPCWQALASIGVYAAELCTDAETSAEKAVLQELVREALGPLEALLGSLALKPREESKEDEQVRMLFYTRFALGLVLLAKGDKQRSKAILHEMAATELSVRGTDFRSGRGIVGYTPDMAWGKVQSALYLLPEYMAQEDYAEMLYLLTEAAASYPFPQIVSLAPEILDRWAAECGREDATPAFNFPTLNWLDLFAEAGEILSVCREADSEGALPSECKSESAQSLAWKFGQIVGRFAVPDSRWHDDPFGNLSEFLGIVEDEEFLYQRGQERTYQTLKVVLSLLCEYDPTRDWQKLQKQYVRLWKFSDSYRGMPLADIGPDTDLYWAMRIGFVDKMLETTEQRAIIELQPGTPSRIRDIEMIKDIVSTVALRLLKQQQTLDGMLERLPPNKREIAQRLQQQLGPVWIKLPATVVNTLVKAENYYRTEVDDPNAKVEFHKAVEASLNCCLVEPLVSFIEKRSAKEIAVCFPPPQGVTRMTSSQLRKLSLWEWSDVLETLAAPAHKDLAGLGTNDLKEFLKTHLGGSRLPDFHSLSRSLRMFSQYRKGSAHYQDAVSRSDKERGELAQMRNLVLGIGINELSVITKIFQDLSAEKQLKDDS